MSDNAQWNLFGIDLSQLLARAKLGVSQLIFDPDSAIYRACCPAVKFYRAGSDPWIWVPAPPAFLPSWFVESVSSVGVSAAVVLERSVLTKSMSLPAETEVELPQIVDFEVAANTPFPLGETVFGWQVVERTPAQLNVQIAMTSRAAVDEALDHVADVSVGSREEAEVWAETESGMLLLPGFAEQNRRSHYSRVLGLLTAKISLVVAACLLFLLVPLAWLSIKSSQLESQLAETQERATSVTRVRDALSDLDASIEIAEAFFQDRPIYDQWLDQLAHVTPDSVFLQRLQLQSSQLTITGLAENAADYQTLLASSGNFSSLQSPTAFTRDTRQNRERFVLVMQLAGEDL